MIEDIERASPGLIQLGAFTYGLFIDNIGYYIVFINTITEFINRFLKYGFFKPLFGTNIPLLGRGARPKGAKKLWFNKNKYSIKIIWYAFRSFTISIYHINIYNFKII